MRFNHTTVSEAIPAPAAKELPPRDKTMSLWGHLRELKNRFAIAAIGVIVAMIIGFFVSDWVIDWLMEPIQQVADKRGDTLVGFNYTSIAGPFNQRLRIAFTIGFFLSAPVWLWQIWAFIMPGLTRKEIKYTVGFSAAAIPLFFGGLYLAVTVLPRVIEVMASFTADGASNLYDAQTYYDFVFKFMLAIGVAMVLPVFIVALNMAGILSAKAILKGWRIAVLVCMLFAALATPAADLVSMFMIAGILLALYFMAAGLAVFVDRRRAKKALKIEAA